MSAPGGTINFATTFSPACCLPEQTGRQGVWAESDRNYGARKVWKRLGRESLSAARCTVERLMKHLGLQGVRRGRRCITTLPDETAHKPLDWVQRQFTAARPNPLWVADIINPAIK